MMHHTLKIRVIRMEKSPLEDGKIEIVDTRPQININVSPNGKDIVIPQSGQ